MSVLFVGGLVVLVVVGLVLVAVVALVDAVVIVVVPLAELFGGRHTRGTVESKWTFSMDLHKRLYGKDPVLAVLVDRFKGFDLIMVVFAIAICMQLRMDRYIASANIAFSTNNTNVVSGMMCCRKLSLLFVLVLSCTRCCCCCCCCCS